MVAMTLNLPFASSSDVSSPKPLEAPVIKATFSVMRGVSYLKVGRSIHSIEKRRCELAHPSKTSEGGHSCNRPYAISAMNRSEWFQNLQWIRPLRCQQGHRSDMK